MKRGTIRHPKVAALMRELGINRREVLGLLTMLWDWAGDYATAGDVGRFSDHELAEAVEWGGDAAQLVEALVAARWLDRCAVNRLVIHDWADHCEDLFKKRLQRAGRPFATAVADNGGQWQTTADNGGQRLPASASASASASANATTTTTTSAESDGGGDAEKFIEAICHPGPAIDNVMLEHHGRTWAFDRGLAKQLARAGCTQPDLRAIWPEFRNAIRSVDEPERVLFTRLKDRSTS